MRRVEEDEDAQVTTGGKGAVPWRDFGPRAKREEFVQILCIYADLVVPKKAEHASTLVCDNEDRGSIRC